MLFVGSSSHLRRNRLTVALLATGLACSGFGLAAATSASGAGRSRVEFPNSVRAVSGSANGTRPMILRTALTADESSQELTVEVALKMHAFDELQSRVAAGGQVSLAELSQRYFPTQDEETQVVQWLNAEGLTVTRVDSDHLAVFARGTISQLSQAFGVQFGRVSAKGREYSSAISAPSVPSEISALVQGIHGLQPHIRPHRTVSDQALAGSAGYMPAQIVNAYGGGSLGVTGSGQTIAVYAFRFPSKTDLTTFWTNASSAQSANNVTFVNVAEGPATSADTEDYTSEACLDVEWSGAIAPGANIRVYGGNEDDTGVNDEILQQVIADLGTYPIHQMCICIAGGEDELDRDYLVIQAQYMATLASQGVSVFAASGDNGNQDGNGVVSPLSPATDPSVTGVGGTYLTLDVTNSVVSETGWADSGGGYSAFFARPGWQTVTSNNSTGVSATNTMRMVPDVAACADSPGGLLIVQNNKTLAIEGTSAATPMWAAFAALLNQQRVAANQGLLGCLNPRIYGLNGSTSFRQVSSGNNGYAAGPGYNLVTGLGVPVLANFFAATLASNSAASVTSQLPDPFVTVGQPATFFVNGVGAPTLTYQWQREPAGSSSYSVITEGTNYAGTASPLLVVRNSTLSNSGDKYECVVANTVGSTSVPATLTVSNLGVTTLAGWPESEGSTNATGWQARFSFIGGIKYDPTSNALYVADASNDLVRKVTLAGVVTTVAGQAGVSGSADGTTSTATFNGIGGVAIDSSGNIYVADSGNYTIRKITPAGVVSTLAGQAGNAGYLDGTGTAAKFVDPENICVDSSGNVYVADGAGYRVRKVTPAGVVSTVAGSGVKGHTNANGTTASFGTVYAVVVDGSGNVYASDGDYNQIRKIDTSGNVTLLAGNASGRAGSTDGTGTAASFNLPNGLCVDASGNLYVADTGNDTIREVTPAGVVTTVAGVAGTAENIDGQPLAAEFAAPSEVTIDPYGVLYVGDGLNSTVRRIVLSSANLTAPTITTQPASATVTAGSSASFSVAASGPGILAYQWTFNGSNLSGATSATYSISSTTTSNAGSYAVVVSNAYGSVTSGTATLTVNASSSSSGSTSTSSGGSSGSGGGGGGGGAPSDWFLVALGGLTAFRMARARRRA